jgi:hypothetical protein
MNAMSVEAGLVILAIVIGLQLVPRGSSGRLWQGDSRP